LLAAQDAGSDWVACEAGGDCFGRVNSLYTTVSVTGTVRAPPELRLMVILSV